jgi:hypothetical protein
MDRLAADPIALGDLDHREPVAQDFHDGVEVVLCHCELQEHALDLLTSTRVVEAEGRAGHVNHQPEHWNPSAGISTTTINRVRAQGDVGALPEICQKLRYT